LTPCDYSDNTPESIKTKIIWGSFLFSNPEFLLRLKDYFAAIFTQKKGVENRSFNTF